MQKLFRFKIILVTCLVSLSLSQSSRAMDLDEVTREPYLESKTKNRATRPANQRPPTRKPISKEEEKSDAETAQPTAKPSVSDKHQLSVQQLQEKLGGESGLQSSMKHLKENLQSFSGRLKELQVKLSTVGEEEEPTGQQPTDSTTEKTKTASKPKRRQLLFKKTDEKPVEPVNDIKKSLDQLLSELKEKEEDFDDTNLDNQILEANITAELKNYIADQNKTKNEHLQPIKALIEIINQAIEEAKTNEKSLTSTSPEITNLNEQIEELKTKITTYEKTYEKLKKDITAALNSAYADAKESQAKAILEAQRKQKEEADRQGKARQEQEAQKQRLEAERAEAQRKAKELEEKRKQEELTKKRLEELAKEKARAEERKRLETEAPEKWDELLATAKSILDEKKNPTVAELKHDHPYGRIKQLYDSYKATNKLEIKIQKLAEKYETLSVAIKNYKTTPKK